MKILLVSNQCPNQYGVGNPIMMRMQKAFSSNKRVSKVEFVPFYNKISSLLHIRRQARDYDIIHVHFGGLYALLVRLFLLGVRKRMFITFHGTDIHAKSVKTTKSIFRKLKIIFNQKASFICICLYDKCGMVAKEMVSYVPGILLKRYKKKLFYQPLGVDYDIYTPVSKQKAQEIIGVSRGHYILFSDVSNTKIKRRDIAAAIAENIGEPYKLLIMCGVKPNDVPMYINACDCVLLTSDEEGSPNIIRESFALNKPVFSVNVGDAVSQLNGLNNSTIISRIPKEAAKTILEYLKRPYTDNTRSVLQKQIDFKRLCDSIIDIYEEI